MKTDNANEPPRPASFFTLEKPEGALHGLRAREIVSCEPAFAGDAPYRAVDHEIEYRRRPYSVRLVQNPLVNYELAMAEHARFREEYELLKADWLVATEIARKQTQEAVLRAWQKCHGQWGVAHWYILEELASEERTVGMSAFFFEGLHREGKLTLYK